MICHRCLLSVRILGAYTHASPMFPLSIPSSLIQTTLLSYNAPYVVTNFAYLCAIIIPTPPFPTALGLSQLLSPGTSSRIQLALPGMSLAPRFSNALPLNLCSYIITTSILGVKELKKDLSFEIFSGSFKPHIL